MAKSKKAKIKLSVPNTKVTTVPIVDSDGLPAYTRYVDSLNYTVRMFFEEPYSADEVQDEQHPDKQYCGAVKFRKKGATTTFLIVRDGSLLIGESIAKTFAQLIIKKLKSVDIKRNTINTASVAIKSLFIFLNSLTNPPKNFNEITIEHLSSWLNALEFKKAKSYKGNVKGLIDLHPMSESLDLSKYKFPNNNKAKPDFSKIDLDNIAEGSDYSDKEVMQLLAYVFYEIEESQKLYHILETSTVENLDEDYIPVLNCSTKNPNITKLLETGVEGYHKLFRHINIFISNENNGIRSCKSATDHNYFMSKLERSTNSLYKNKHNFFIDFRIYLSSFCWSLSKANRNKSIMYPERLQLTSKHHEIAILLYSLITTGLNLETVMSWKRNINSKPWFENYDVELGIDDNTPQRDKSVVLVGEKRRGQRNKKQIATAISISSPLFKYLKFLDKTRPPEREYIFSIKSSLHVILRAFSNKYPIYDDNGNRLEGIETKRIRKVFAGQKLIGLLKDVKNANELTAKLKDALRHESFDTTLFSYILKSGAANLVLNSAIVALTSDLLESALNFKGEIKEDSERSEDSHKVYLCDCTDPSNPSHDIPISDRCRKYDMCLGCERSEVYTEHLPSICYRIMQYENKRSDEPEEFKALLEDRLYIARDTIEQFKIRHKNGEALIEKSYFEACEAMENNTHLLPEILQIGGI